MNIPALPEFTILHFVWIATFIGAIAYAFLQDRRDRQIDPDLRPYRWGYFLGMMGLIAGVTIVLRLLPDIPTKAYPTGFTVYVMVLMVGVVTVFPAILRKKRWAWVMVCLFFLLATRLTFRDGFQVADISIFILAGMNILYAALHWRDLSKPALSDAATDSR